MERGERMDNRSDKGGNKIRVGGESREELCSRTEDGGREEESDRQRDRRIIERRSDQGSRGERGKVFFKDVCNPKTRRNKQSDLRSENAKQKFSIQEIQDGEHTNSKGTDDKRMLVYQNRSKERLPSDSNKKRGSNIFKFSLERKKLLLPGDAIRIVNCTEDIYKNNETSRDEIERRRYQMCNLSGRYFGIRGIKRGFGKKEKEGVGLTLFTRMDDKPEKVNVRTSSRNRVFGFKIGLNKDEHLSTKQEGQRDKERDQEGFRKGSYLNSKLSIVDRKDSGNKSSSFYGTFQNKRDVITKNSGVKSWKLGKDDFFGRGSQNGVEMVVGKHKESKWKGSRDKGNRENINNRCLLDRLGGGTGGTRGDSRRMESGGKEVTHKYIGTESSRKVIKTLEERIRRKSSFSENRQSSNNVLHQQDGRYKVKGVLGSNKKDMELVRTAQDKTQSRIYSRKRKHSSRQFIKKIQFRQNGLEFNLLNFQKDHKEIRSPNNRFVCIRNQQEGGSLCVMENRRRSFCNRRFLNKLERSDFGFRKPTMEVNWKGIKKGKGRGSRNNFGDTSMENSQLVSTIIRTSGRTTNGVEDIKGYNQNRSFKEQPIHKYKLETNRIKAIRKILQERGFSAEAIEVIINSLEDSTNRTYQSFWKRWVEWCEKENINSMSPRTVDIINFLTKLPYSSLAVARSALASTLGIISGIKLAEISELKFVLRGKFKLDPPKPRYDKIYEIDIIKEYIKKNLSRNQDLDILELSKKTVVLLAAEGIMRSSDLFRISKRSIEFDEIGVKFVVISPKEKSIQRPHRFVKIKKDSDPDICPVRALQEYLRRRNWITFKESERVWLNIKYPFSPCSKDVIAKWIKELIHQSGVTTEFKAHSIRSAAATALVKKGESIERVMERGNWTSRSVFSKFYDRS